MGLVEGRRSQRQPRGRVREYVFRNVLGEMEVAKSGGGGKYGRAVALLLTSHRNARREKLTIIIHWNERAKTKRKVSTRWVRGKVGCVMEREGKVAGLVLAPFFNFHVTNFLTILLRRYTLHSIETEK